jgi:hypothetical protein
MRVIEGARGNRRKARGAVMVESIIVLCLLTIFFASGLFLFSIYRAKLNSFGQATALGFQEATAGCGKPFGGSYDINSLLLKPAPDPFDSVPDDAFLGAVADTTNRQVSFSGAKPDMLGGGTWNVDTQVKLMCNEPPMTEGEALKSFGIMDWAVTGVLKNAGLP